MAVFSNGTRQARRPPSLVIVCALTEVPAKVCATGRSCWEKINFLPHILAYIANEQITCRSIKRKSPWVPQTIGPDFIPKGIVGGNSIGLGRVNVQAKD